MPTGLVTFLQGNANVIKADLFAIILPTGTFMFVTEGQFDITVPSGTPGWTFGTTTFLASQYGKWTRGAITSEGGFNLNSNSMNLTCVPQQGTTYPNLSVGILSAAFNGLFEAAQISVYTCYMPLGNFGNVSHGIETKFVGFIEKIDKINRNTVRFVCQDPLFLCNEQIPKRLIQSGCPWSFGDGNCNPPGGVAAFTQTFTAKSGSTQYVLTPVTAFSQATGYFTQGVVKCTSGANAGLGSTVKLHDSSGNLNLTLPWLLPVTAGDTFSVVAGCDKTAPTCTTKFNNKIHYGGEIAVPVPINAL